MSELIITILHIIFLISAIIYFIFAITNECSRRKINKQIENEIKEIEKRTYS